jgi:hypothetical protein
MGALSGTAKALGLSPVTDPEAFAMLFYEDNDRLCYINPAERPREAHTLRFRFGRPPEELSRSSLRPEQHKFFKRYLPSLYKRFKE